MKNLILFLIAIILISSQTNAQVGINTNGSQPDPSAGLDVKFNNKGFLPPRMTQVQRNAIQNPAEGLMVICIDCGLTNPKVLSIYLDGAWRLLTGNCTAPPAAPIAATHIASLTKIIWNWDPVEGATGYKWNFTNDYATAIDKGNVTSVNESGLICSTSYTRYVWSYNNCGKSAGTLLTQATLTCVICGQPITDTRDSKTYNTVLIGTHCWMAQNLNVGTRINSGQEQTNHSAIEKYCHFDDEANCTDYGGLYQWDNMMQWSVTPGVQGICPAGWHIPTDGEWTILTTFLGGENIAGGKMKEAGYMHWASPNTGATNESGFTALPGGGRWGEDDFRDLTYTAYFWPSSQVSTDNAHCLYLTNYNAVASMGTCGKTLGFSVRCVQD